MISATKHREEEWIEVIETYPTELKKNNGFLTRKKFVEEVIPQHYNDKFSWVKVKNLNKWINIVYDKEREGRRKFTAFGDKVSFCTEWLSSRHNVHQFTSTRLVIIMTM